MKIRRALLSVSDKSQLLELGKALAQAGAELIATGNTAKVLKDGGLKITPIEEVSGAPEAFQGRMKTLSFPVCAGILSRRGDASDESDLKKLNIQPIDCVVVNFYPFEKEPVVEQIDIGGPTLVRAAAKNSPDVLVLTDPAQYAEVIAELSQGEISPALAAKAAARAWERVAQYDVAIREKMGECRELSLRYGENPHQSARLVVDSRSPIRWDAPLTDQELSYNNILDLSGAYSLATSLVEEFGAESGTGVVIVKHNNPCGVAWVPKKAGLSAADAQKTALLRAWEGDSVSAFGGVLVFTHAIEPSVAAWLAERFVECIGAPEWTAKSETLLSMTAKRKKLKAVRIERFETEKEPQAVRVPGAVLYQTLDHSRGETLKCVTKREWPADKQALAQFGIQVCRVLKSNAIAIVRDIPEMPGAMQLIGAGQGQPNRIEALEKLAIPRAQAVLRESGGRLSDCLMISDAFFPFRDTVDRAATAGIRHIVQPGGSLKDAESIQACDENNISMVFTGTRHFRH